MKARTGRGISSPGAALALLDIAEQYLVGMALRCTPKTARDARTVLTRLLRDTGWTRVEHVTRPGLDQWRAARTADGMSNRTINRHTIALAGALSLAVELRQIDYNPLAGMRTLSTKGRHRRRVARALPDDDIRKLLEAAAKIDARHEKRFPRAPLLRALLLTGCRWHELVSTIWADLDSEHGRLRLRGEHTKTSEERTIPLDPDLLARILALRVDHVRVTGELPQAGSRIFLTPNGKPWPQGTSNYHRFLEEVLRVAHIPKKTRRAACSTSTRPAARSSPDVSARTSRRRSRRN